MKKLLISTLFVLLSIISINAQEIAGRWTTSLTERKDDIELTAVSDKTYSNDGKTKSTITFNVKKTDGDKSLFKIRISYSGTWSESNRILTESVDGKSVMTELSDYPEDMPKMIVNMIKNSCSSEIKKNIRKPSHHKIESITDKEMKLRDIDNEDADVVTYVRK